jgi:stage V sporulation protein R
MNELLEKRSKWFQEKAIELGLDFFPINFEVVPEEVMLEIQSYGLPTRPRHWSYGQSYEYQKIYGKMGLSKVYEVVLNNDPSYAFLLDSNTDVANTMVIAHVIGHVHFFKNNFLFKETNRKMVYQSAERASRIEEYITKYGIDKVEHIMDIAFSMDKNIDWNKGEHRKPYPNKKKIIKRRFVDEFEDLFGVDEPIYKEEVVNAKFPPHPEYDLLWFLINYSNLESWERDIFQITREEAFYFYPQYYTKIMNEGFASYMHAELMFLMEEEDLTAPEYMDFCKIHERVVQPGADQLSVNPYFLGFTIFNDIKERWDKEYEEGNSDITGIEKIFEVVRNEDDISFLRTYLTQDIVDKLNMFTYRTYYDRRKDEYVEIMSREAKYIVENLTKKLYNYTAPLIKVVNASSSGLELEHESIEVGTLDPKHLNAVMGYIYEVWGGVIDLKTVDDEGNLFHYTYDELGFSDCSDADSKKP